MITVTIAASATTGSGLFLTASASRPETVTITAGASAFHAASAARATTVTVAAPATRGGAPEVVNTWQNSRSITTGFAIAPPAGASLTCPVASSAGNWLIAFVSWTMPAGYLGCTMAVADDQHGFWVPCGAPSGDSSATGYTRCAIWARPASPAVPGANTVYVAPCGLPGPVYPAVTAVTVIEVTGMSDYAGIPAAVTAVANASASISANAAAPTGPALMLTAPAP